MARKSQIVRRIFRLVHARDADELTPRPADEREKELIDGDWEELKVIRDTHVQIWSVYFQWFTWFYSLTLTALGFVLGTKYLRGTPLTILGTLWSVCILVGLATALVMTIYARDVIKRAEFLLWRLGRIAQGASTSSTHASLITLFAGPGCAFVLLLAFGAWVYVIAAYG